MGKKIKPSSKTVIIERELNRIAGEVYYQTNKLPGLDESWVPYVDIAEKENEITIEIELPGISRSDIAIKMNYNRVEIKGIKKEKHHRKQVKYVRLEREYGPFRRIIFLPSAVYPDTAKAYLENGVLTLRLKKHRSQKNVDVVLDINKSEEK